MKYIVEVSSSANGDRFHVYVPGNHDLDKLFHAGQKHSVIGADGKKVSALYKETPRKRCAAYCKELEAMGYEEEVSQMVKDFREACSLMHDMDYTAKERTESIGGIMDNMPKE